MKPSSTETNEKRMSRYSVFETKIKTDQKLFLLQTDLMLMAWNAIHN